MLWASGEVLLITGVDKGLRDKHEQGRCIMENYIYWLTQLRQTTRGNPDMKTNQILQINRKGLHRGE